MVTGTSPVGTYHPIVLEGGYPPNTLSSNGLCPPQVGTRDGHVQVQGDHLLSSHCYPSNQGIPPSHPTYPLNQSSIHAYREPPVAYGKLPMYRQGHHFDNSPVGMTSPTQGDVHLSPPGNVHMLPNSQGYPLAANGFHGATPLMMDMPRNSRDAKGHPPGPAQRNISTPRTSRNKGLASAQSVRVPDTSDPKGRHSAGQKQRHRESSSSSSEERQRCQRQSMASDDRYGSSSSSTEDSST